MCKNHAKSTRFEEWFKRNIIVMGGDQLTSDTMTKCTDGEDEMVMMGGDELFGDDVGSGDFMNDDDTSKTGDDEGNKANNIIPSMCSDNEDTHSDIGNCPHRSARIKAKLDKMGDECTMVESLYPEPDSKFPKIDLNDFGKSMHNLHFVWN